MDMQADADGDRRGARSCSSAAPTSPSGSSTRSESSASATTSAPLFDATPSFICTVDASGLDEQPLAQHEHGLADGLSRRGGRRAAVRGGLLGPRGRAAVTGSSRRPRPARAPASRRRTGGTRDGRQSPRRLERARRCRSARPRGGSSSRGRDVTERRRREDEEAALTPCRRRRCERATGRRTIFQAVTQEVGQLLGATRADMIRFDQQRDQASSSASGGATTAT